MNRAVSLVTTESVTLAFSRHNPQDCLTVEGKLSVYITIPQGGDPSIAPLFSLMILNGNYSNVDCCFGMALPFNSMAVEHMLGGVLARLLGFVETAALNTVSV